ncbi:DUF1684 domain-containing protein [Salinimicrobium sp. GXAS 041]|uniref:DUF1684 domain-containing protein n=1 Tax=Salinimicrobium sp. GXAS 041 TaxID=3400806 RepID=UPI003C768640
MNNRVAYSSKMAFLLLILFFISLSDGIAQETSEFSEFQKELNASFHDPDESPLKEEDLQNFTSLDFFPVNNKYLVEAEFVRTPYETPFEMPTTTERKPVYVKYGEVYFELEGKEYKLNLYQNQELIKKAEYEDYLFIPFTDLTNGNSSYSGGRYLDMRIPDSKRILIDFNKAYNPYCAYNGKYSCPIPPSENHLDVAITAGVKAFKK